MIPWILTSVLFVLLVFVLVAALATARRLRYLEELFYDSLEDLQHSASIFDTLVNRRSLLSNDPDVQQIKQVFGVTLDILGELIRYGQEIAERPPTEERGEEEE